MTKRFRKLSHTLYECKYHLVFCPKYRHKILVGELAEQVRQEIYRLVSQQDGVEVLELNIQPDHVHLVAWIPPKLSVSNFMGFLKGKMTLRLLNRNEHLMKRYWGRHFWSRGYCVSTVGLDEEKIRLYVKWQEQRDRTHDQQQGRLFDE